MTCSITLDQFISDNYTDLKRIAKQSTHLPMDLISYYYIYLKRIGWVKIEKLTHNEKIRFSKTWLKNTSKWSNTPFADLREVNNLIEVNGEFDPFRSNIVIDESVYDKIMIGAEDTSDNIKEWLMDMTSEYGDDVDKLILIKYHYHHSLDLSEQILFDLVYTEMLSTRQVAQRIKIPHTSAYLLVKALEKRLQILCTKRLN